MPDEIRRQLQQQAQPQDPRSMLQQQAQPAMEQPARQGPLGRNPVVQEGLAITRQLAQGPLELLAIPQQGVDAIAGLMGFNIPRGPRLFDFKEPETRAQAAANVVGQSAAATLPVVGMGVRGLQAGGQATTTAGAVTRQIGESAVRQPGRFALTEVTAGAGAGAAGFEAQRLFPDSTAARAFGELAGGFAGSAAPFAIGQAANVATGAGSAMATGVPFAGQLIRRAGQSIREFLTPHGAFRRGQERIRRATPDPEGALQRAEDADVLPDAPFTIPQRAGDRGLLAMERSVMDSTARLSQRRQEQFTEINEAIRDSLQQTLASPRRVDPETAREYLTGLLDTRISQAQQITDQRLRELSPSATREDANRLAEEELRRVLNIANRQEEQLWQALPRDMPAPTDNARRAYQAEVGKMSSTERRRNIPDAAREALDPESDTFLGSMTTFNELRGLRSELRREARVARSENNFNKGRVADNLADVIVDDVSQISPRVVGEDVRGQLETAIAFSKDKNDRFTRGEVGRLLGTNRDGGSQVPAGLALESTVGRSGPRARVATDALLEAVRRSGNEEVMRGHITDFLKDQFNRAAVRTTPEGVRVDTRAARQFMEANQDVLGRFDGLRRQMRQAIEGGETTELLERVTDPRVSRAAVFLNAPPGREMDRILNSRDPRRAIQDVLELAGRDPEGLAVGGLRTAFLDRVLTRSASRARDLGEHPFVAGRNLETELSLPANRQVIEELYSPDQQRKLQTIVNSARRLDDARESPAAAEGILGDGPGVIMAIMSRFGGAQFGNFVARTFGGANIQTPAIFSAAFRNAARRGVSDPGTALLTEAMDGGNPDLFRSLVLDAAARPQNEDFIRTQLNAWLASVGAEPLTPEAIENERTLLEQQSQQEPR